MSEGCSPRKGPTCVVKMTAGKQSLKKKKKSLLVIKISAFSRGSCPSGSVGMGKVRGNYAFLCAPGSDLTLVCAQWIGHLRKGTACPFFIMPVSVPRHEQEEAIPCRTQLAECTGTGVKVYCLLVVRSLGVKFELP